MQSQKSSLDRKSIRDGNNDNDDDDDSRLRRQKQLQDDHEDTSCGIGSWRPEWLQFFASPKFFLINLGLVGIIQGCTGTIFFSSISTFEKRYAFDSRLSAIIMIADNFADMVVSFVSPFDVNYDFLKYFHHS